MSTSPKISMAGAEVMLNALTTLLNGGSIRIYTGGAPATLETSASGTLLSSGCTYAATAFANAVDGGAGSAVATSNAIGSDNSAAATGTAGYFRGLSSGAVAVIQGTCGTSSADMIMASTTITMNAPVAVQFHQISMPDGSGSD